MQQAFVGADQRRAREPAARCLFAQHIAQRHQCHALVVGHKVFNDAKSLCIWLTRCGVVKRVHETVLASRTDCFKPSQVGYRLVRVEHAGHDAGIRSNDMLACRHTLERQPRHAKR